MSTPITGLNDLFARMAYEDPSVMSGDDWSTSLPTFGGEAPSDTACVWSWNETHLIVGSCADDLEIVKRTEWAADVSNPADAGLSPSQRVEQALAMALDCGVAAGDHHKTWVLDQVVRILTGDDYNRVIADRCAGEDGPETYEWDEGVAP